MVDFPALSIVGLSKHFTGQLALDDVSLELASGEIRGLIGENGAGKSTLIKLLAGIHAPDHGVIKIDGHVVHPHLERLPIAFVHQDLGLVDELSVGENIAFTMGFPRKFSMIDWKKTWGQAVSAYEKMGLTPPSVKTLVGRLSPAEKALLGIVRALAADASIAVLDEPTSALPAPDVKYLHEALLKLRGSGTSIIYVTHRLQELYSVADSVTILREGKKILEGGIKDFSVDNLVENMLGRSIPKSNLNSVQISDSKPIVEVKDLVIHGISNSFNVLKGEVLGLVGLRGAGQEDIGRALAGAETYISGELRVGKLLISHNEGIVERMSKGIALLPADRQRESTFPGMSLVENLYPGKMNRSGNTSWISHSHENRNATALFDEFDVRPRVTSLPIDQLSGGNQQKIVVARVLEGNKNLVVLEQPTAGVDVGSKFQIHEFVRKAANGGTAVIVISSDFEEVAKLCTRVLIVVDGSIQMEATGSDITEDRLVVLASSNSSKIGTALI